jgi:hypothetical protein
MLDLGNDRSPQRTKDTMARTRGSISCYAAAIRPRGEMMAVVLLYLIGGVFLLLAFSGVVGLLGSRSGDVAVANLLLIALGGIPGMLLIRWGRRIQARTRSTCN